MGIDIARTITEAQEALLLTDEVILQAETVARQAAVEAEELMAEHSAVQAAYDEALADEVAVMR